MAGQHDDPKHKEKTHSPSTGRGAASALDAMIKRRAPAPNHPPQSQQPQPPSSKKH